MTSSHRTPRTALARLRLAVFGPPGALGARALRPVRLALALALVLGSAYGFGVSGLLAIKRMRDPALRRGGVPESALALHRSVSARFAPWARARIASGAAAHIPLHDVPENEWPIFSAVFFLSATESLRDQGVDVRYAAPSVRAARDLIMDPVHHTWVRTHWGDDYLHDHNVFFRSLLIAGLSSYESLTHDGGDLAFLRDQVETLAADLDASPHGVLEDYPGETYPIDVMAAVAYIKRADRVLGTDHSAFVARARRAFVAPYDDELGLVRFRVDLYGDAAPAPNQPGRGIGNSWVGIYAAELWPADAARWHATHTEHFWQDASWASGFREYRRGGPEGEWTFEIDAGPVVGGFGTAASAFGIAAARRSGRLDQAYTLTTQMLATGWPAPDGSLRSPQAFSHPAAPLLGESALAYFLTLPPADGVPVVTGGRVTPLVWLALLLYFGVFALGLWLAYRMAPRTQRVAGRLWESTRRRCYPM
ncbi:MAG: hypothetical protein H6725_18770 [Sandaracinaceae bacterium]|nr:hypothetical protein [Sandaracinaceae bacterium]